MMDVLAYPQSAPFVTALMLMILIGVVELVGVLFGLSPSDAIGSMLPEVDVGAGVEMDLDLEADIEFEADAAAGAPLDVDAPSAPDVTSAGPLSQFLSWLGVGRVPILILLVVFLTVFGLSGLLIQSVATGVFGAPLPAFIAAAPALFATMPVTRSAAMAIARLFPREETEAVSQRSFIGRIATVIRGEAKNGAPAEAKLIDAHGQTHYLLIEPDVDDDIFGQGEEAVIVRKVEGGVYRAIRHDSAALA